LNKNRCRPGVETRLIGYNYLFYCFFFCIHLMTHPLLNH
jgi:hypothetical protein